MHKTCTCTCTCACTSTEALRNRPIRLRKTRSAGADPLSTNNKTQHVLFTTSNRTRALAQSAAPIDQFATSATARLLARLHDIGESDSFLFGHQNTGFSTQTAQARFVVSDILTSVGGFPAVVGFNLANLRNRALRTALQDAQRRGAVLTASWEATNPLTGGNAHDADNNTVASILAGGPATERWKQMLDEAADFLRSLDTPVLLRPFHENTGDRDGYWWAAGACTAEEYRRLWRLTQLRLWDRGAHNLLFVYSPAKPDRDWSRAFKAYYPGSAQVDVIAFDYYGADDISRGLASCCQQTAAFAAAEGKPTAIAEFGMQGGFGSKGSQYTVSPKWFMDSFLHPVLTSKACRRIAYALTWTNAAPNRYYVPLPHQSAHPSFVELYRSGSAVFAGEALERLGVTPELLADRAAAAATLRRWR